MIVINLPFACTFAQWRVEAKDLLQRNIHPYRVEWYSVSDEPDLFSDTSPATTNKTRATEEEYRLNAHVPAEATSSGTAPIMISAAFIRQCKLALCHRSTDKFALLYRLLWRISHDEPHVLDMAMDADVKKLALMCKAVRRDLHKMTAFVRFDCVSTERCSDLDSARPKTSAQNSEPTQEPLYYAWFEPEHNILVQAGEFFMKRFSNVQWTIATPVGSIYWDKVHLTIDHTPILTKPDVHDDIVALWDTYYASIFNPARLKLKAMHAEMPRKYWHNLPETNQISALSTDAPTRKHTMLAAKPSRPPRWAKKSGLIK